MNISPSVVPTLSVGKWVCSCFNSVAREESIADKLNDAYRKKGFNVTFLPINASTFNLKDLYPHGNQVEFWTTFVVGAKSQFICASTDHLDFERPSKSPLNTDGAGILSEDLRGFLQPIFDKCLKFNTSIMLLCVINSITYLINGFPLSFNGNVVGCSVFIRRFDNHPSVVPPRKSLDGMDISSVLKAEDRSIDGRFRSNRRRSY